MAYSLQYNFTYGSDPYCLFDFYSRLFLSCTFCNSEIIMCTVFRMGVAAPRGLANRDGRRWETSNLRPSLQNPATLST